MLAFRMTLTQTRPRHRCRDEVSRMDRTEFESLVNRLEHKANERPGLYRAQVFGFAALGYAFLAALVLALLALSIGAALSVVYLKAAGIKLFFVVSAFLWVVVRALWVRLSPPTGDVVSRSDAPALHATLERLRQQLQTARIHEVQVTADFNAAIAQVPRFGPVGGCRNYLLVGLPLMQALTVEQFEAVLAHELGHLARGHARASNWIYRLRLMWVRLEAALGERAHWGSRYVRAFYQWYIPRFQAISFPLARANEYEADAAAARLTSARVTGQALTNVNVVGSFLNERYWPQIHAAAKEVAQPSFAPYSGFDAAALEQISDSDRARWLEIALRRETSFADTHPSLSDRLAAIGAGAEIVIPQPGRAAAQLLGPSLERFQSRFDQQWRAAIGESWRKYHEDIQSKRQALTALRSEEAAEPLAEPRALELADLEETVGEGADSALALRRALMQRFPDSARVKYALSRQMLLADEADGVALMEEAIGQDADALVEGGALLRDYFWRRGEKTLGDRWHARSAERLAILRGAQAERARVTTTDAWVPHGLEAATRQRLCERLREIPTVRRVYLVRKQLKYLPEHPLYIAAFSVTPWYRSRDFAASQAVMQELRDRVDWPGHTLILNVEIQPRAIRAKLRRVSQARIV
jgi:Zn-dependent protease with chaperone function